MTKLWQFYDSSGTKRNVTQAYFYDDTGARKEIKQGFFYDSSGARRAFFEGGLPAPGVGYFPGSNFSMKAGENSTYTGFQGGAFGEIRLDGTTATNFPLYPTTVADPHQAQMFYSHRLKADSSFEMYWYWDPFNNPADSTKFYGINIEAENGLLADVLIRTQSVETLEVNSVQNKWSYIVPLTLGSIYIFKFHEIAWTGTVTAGTSNLFRGYSSGGGSVPAAGSISPANTIATRTGWSVVTFGTTGGEEVMLELKGPAGSTDPGLNFICGFTVSAAGIGSKKVNDLYSYTWNNTTKVAQWIWEDTTQLVNGSAYTLTLG